MSDNKLECTDSYILPQGPIGEAGPTGPQGQPGISGNQGLAGATGLSGRSKIDINLRDGVNDYREASYISANGNKYAFLGTFIYPGNTAFGGDPTELRVLMENSGVTASTGYNSYRFTFVKLDSQSLGGSVDTMVSANKVLTSSAFGAYESSNDVLRIQSIRNIENLPDEQTILSLYVASPKYAGITFKCYSVEIY